MIECHKLAIRALLFKKLYTFFFSLHIIGIFLQNNKVFDHILKLVFPPQIKSKNAKAAISLALGLLHQALITVNILLPLLNDPLVRKNKKYRRRMMLSSHFFVHHPLHIMQD